MSFGEECRIVNWIENNDGFEYYKSYFNRLSEIRFFERGNKVVGLYEGFLVLEMQMIDRQVFLYADLESYKDEISSRGTDEIVQKKLNHEYIRYFGLEKGTYKITRDNTIEIEKYCKIAKAKIDVGFEDFKRRLEEQKITSENAVYYRIELNRSFTFTELSKLLLAYNQIYSFLCYVNKYGIEKLEDIDSVDKDELWNSKELVLESIHIASPGVLDCIGGLFECAGKAIDLKTKSEEAKAAEAIAKRETNKTNLDLILTYEDAKKISKEVNDPVSQAYLDQYLKGLEKDMDTRIGRQKFDAKV